ncbi:MAG: YihY/virulence factor BrkB family protein, partial [Muribaculaceae bacterium]|nr:YihY/virulence factor BrkB family protein [Muribaculaceae bacterium]
LAGPGYIVLQWIFVTGQMYVARYNAIYGSFSFLPLMLIWLQLVYVVMFAGAVICYASQNIFMYNFKDAISNMSSSYYARLTIAICAVIVQRFIKGQGATTINYMSQYYSLPPKLATMLCDKMVAAGIINIVEIDPKKEIKGFQPAIDPDNITVAELFSRLNGIGSSDFIPEFEQNFPGVVSDYNMIQDNELKVTNNLKLADIKIKN